MTSPTPPGPTPPGPAPHGPAPHGPAPPGLLTDNILYFGRVLRAAGLPIGPGHIIGAVEAVTVAGLARRQDLYWALHAALVNRRDQREMFDQAFQVFWRDPGLLDRVMALALPDIAPLNLAESSAPGSRRLGGAMGGGGEMDAPKESKGLDASLTFSDRELLQRRDFDQMSAAELSEARRLIAGLTLPVADVGTRRFRSHPRGDRANMRATLRAMSRGGGEAIPLRRRQRRLRPPTLVVLCDISGSMGRYSRMLLHFVHALANDRARVQAFVFGTRLTNITRHLRYRDVDVALEAVSRDVDDWSGGTRIGASLADFNITWSRRVLAQGAVVLLISDGLDRGAGAGLAGEMERLHKSCRSLIWLNPLLRYAGFEPKSLGVRAMLPHVDRFLPVHSLDSLAALARILAEEGNRDDQPSRP